MSASELNALKTKNEQLERQVQEINDARERDRVVTFVEGLSRDRKLYPADKEKEVDFILSLPNGEVVDYGEDGELTQRQRYMAKLNNGKALWSDKRPPIDPQDAPASYAEGTEDYSEAYSAQGIKQHKAIQKYMAEHNVTYSEAVDRLKIAL